MRRGLASVEGTLEGDSKLILLEIRPGRGLGANLCIGFLGLGGGGTSFLAIIRAFLALGASFSSELELRFTGNSEKVRRLNFERVGIEDYVLTRHDFVTSVVNDELSIRVDPF